MYLETSFFQKEPITMFIYLVPYQNSIKKKNDLAIKFH